VCIVLENRGRPLRYFRANAQGRGVFFFFFRNDIMMGVCRVDNRPSLLCQGGWRERNEMDMYRILAVGP
jgi:hypothetical protein